MIIRPATSDDARLIAAVHVESWQHGYRDVVPQSHLDGTKPDDRLDRWQGTLNELDPPDTAVLVAEDKRGLTGFAFFGPARDVAGNGGMFSLYTRPEVWGTVLSPRSRPAGGSPRSGD